LERVKADTLEGRAAGVSGTPTFFINGQPLVGAQPIEAFKQQLDPLLGQ
jgi:protein-disulfide isomerase